MYEDIPTIHLNTEEEIAIQRPGWREMGFNGRVIVISTGKAFSYSQVGTDSDELVPLGYQQLPLTCEYYSPPDPDNNDHDVVASAHWNYNRLLPHAPSCANADVESLVCSYAGTDECPKYSARPELAEEASTSAPVVFRRYRSRTRGPQAVPYSWITEGDTIRNAFVGADADERAAREFNLVLGIEGGDRHPNSRSSYIEMLMQS